MIPDGLRARKKLATREALSLAARRLALTQGLDNVRVEAIAAAAGVSPRTYNNYFSSREEAICAVSVQRAEHVSAALRARPAEEPLAEALTHVIVDQYAGAEPDKELILMISSTPALLAEFLKAAAAAERPLAEAIAARTGLDADRDLFPLALAAAVSSAQRSATRFWLRSGAGRPYVSVLRQTLALIAPMAVPPTSTPSESAC